MKNKNLNQNNIFIHQFQINNPLIKDFFFNYKVENNLECDFKIADKYFCYFLSLKYHETFPTYIDARINSNVGTNKGNYKYLFCMFDINTNDYETTLKNLEEDITIKMNLDIIYDEMDNDNIFDNLDLGNKKNKTTVNRVEALLTDINFICINANTTLVLCYSGYDLAQYIYSLSQMQNNEYGVDRMKTINQEEELIETLCTIDKLNKNDATNLLKTFQDVKTVLNSNSNLLSLAPGMTQKKIKAIDDFLKFEFSNFSKNKK